ncbi:MAG: hypothetical protein JXB17_09740 [Bacteroidales bacterium]|nr:hypothetical protein [Bacteroidales bacterium]
MSLNIPIGGYFELELTNGEEYHKDSIRLNTGRNAFEYILRTKNISKIFLPYYTCDVVLEPVDKLRIKSEFYHINEKLEPVFNYDSLKEEDYFLYTNYFGIKDDFINRLSNKVSHLIIDNAQAFYSKPVRGADTFYSPRKFFGVPDGGYLYTDRILDTNTEIDISKERFGHLIGRIEDGAEGSYPIFKKNDQKLNNQPIRRMSNITQRLLKNIDYKNVALRRRKNFNYLHQFLQYDNLLNINCESDIVPMVYPFHVVNGSKLRSKLLSDKIFTALYWPNVINSLDKEWVEYELSDQIVSLPIDQRYDLNEMVFILERIKESDG